MRANVRTLPAFSHLLVRMASLLAFVFPIVAIAQSGVTQLVCSWSVGSSGGATLLTIDYDRKTMRIEDIDPAGNIKANTTPEFERQRITRFAEDRIVTSLEGYHSYSLNRYTGRLESWSNISGSSFSDVCRPYQRGPRIY